MFDGYLVVFDAFLHGNRPEKRAIKTRWIEYHPNIIHAFDFLRVLADGPSTAGRAVGLPSTWGARAM
jgi:hypothetical protein